MQHVVEYELKGQQKRRCSTLVLHGTDMENTAIAKTVGLPIGIFAKLVMTGQIKKRGIAVPVSKAAYIPVLKELEEMGIKFEEREEDI